MLVTKYNFSALFSEAWVQAMTPRNIIAGFRTTGVYPPDRSAIKLPGEEVPNLATKSKIAYIPLYTPVKRRISNSEGLCCKFTEKEQDEFQRLYEYSDDEDDSGDGDGDEEGRKDNPRYRSWLQMYHPEMLQLDSPLPSSYQPAVKQSLLGHFLICPVIANSQYTVN